MNRNPKVWPPLLFAAGLLVVVACAGSDDTVTTTPGPTGATSSTSGSTSVPSTSVVSTSVPSTSVPVTSVPVTSVPSTSVPVTTTTLPGEPFDMGFPRSGDRLGVIGVAFDDRLNVREGPGNAPIVATLDPLDNSAVATGRARLLPTTIWWEVTVDGTTGWASSSFLAYLGATDDATADVVAGLGEIPVAETMSDLGDLVARFYASDDPPSDVVMVVAPSLGDLGEVTFDVVGLGDDAIRGIRLHVFGEPVGSGEGFSLKAVERTVLCGRGLAEGACV